MPLLFRSVLSAVLLIMLEATIRKFIYASPVVILAKYVVLLPLFLLAFKRLSLWYSISLLAISLPLLVTIPAISFVPYAVYDLVSIFYLPVILYLLTLEKVIFSTRIAYQILALVSLIGVFNSLLIILQSFLGPQHWLSQTVDQAFSAHAFGDAFKAPGLAGTSSPYMSIAGLIALDVLQMAIPKKRTFKLVPFAQLVIGVSVLFNLVSRTYTLGVVGYLIPRLLIPNIIRKKLDKNALVFLLIPLAYLFLRSELGLDIITTSRTFDDFDSASGRLFAFPIFSLLATNPFEIPFIGGVGLGYTINSNPLADPFYVPPFCSALGLGTEHEYERFICSFGAIGLFHIIARLALAAVALRNTLFFLKPSFPACIPAGWLFFLLTLVNGLLLRANDTASGTLLLLLSLNASQSLLYFKNQELQARNHDPLFQIP
jgi:hypothetical protein